MTEIRTLLPHRPPFLFVDTVERGDQPELVGRFTVPEVHSMWPGSYLIEGIGQCCQALAVLTTSGQGFAQRPQIGLLGRVRATVHGSATGGDHVEYRVKRGPQMGQLMRFSGTAWVADRCVVEADLVASVGPQ